MTSLHNIRRTPSNIIICTNQHLVESSGKESELLPVLLGKADQALPLLRIGADGLAELGDHLRDPFN